MIGSAAAGIIEGTGETSRGAVTATGEETRKTFNHGLEVTNQLVSDVWTGLKERPAAFIVMLVLIVGLVCIILFIFVPHARKTMVLVVGLPFKFLNKQLENTGANGPLPPTVKNESSVAGGQAALDARKIKASIHGGGQ
jgi:predicted PurR-regulated permease PerM